MTDKKLERWKSAVHAAYAASIPNGWLLGWDRTRLQTEIRAAANTFECSNATSFDYSRCNRYEIQLGTKDSNHDVLTVLVSFILDVFSLYWTTYEADGRYGSTASQPMLSQGKIIEENVRRVLAKQGFEEVPAIWYNEPLSGIELELSEPKDVTLGKCLFDDYDG